MFFRYYFSNYRLCLDRHITALLTENNNHHHYNNHYQHLCPRNELIFKSFMMAWYRKKIQKTILRLKIHEKFKSFKSEKKKYSKKHLKVIKIK